MVNNACVKKLSSKARVWIIIFIFIVVVFIVPVCASVGGGLLSFWGTILSVIVTIFASLFGQ
jgi:hypothetical protein